MINVEGVDMEIADCNGLSVTECSPVKECWSYVGVSRMISGLSFKRHIQNKYMTRSNSNIKNRYGVISIEICMIFYLQQRQYT